MNLIWKSVHHVQCPAQLEGTYTISADPKKHDTSASQGFCRKHSPKHRRNVEVIQLP